jgi:hypothetical protein
MLALLALIVAAATSPYHAYADTPQAAALAVVSGPYAPHARVVRTNVAGRFATVLTSGGKMEGEPVRQALLIEHFDFGWQPIGFLDMACPRKILTALERRLLLDGMPSVRADHVCDDAVAAGSDVGSAEAVAALREQIVSGRAVPYVRIVGDFAFAQWCFPGGGQTLYRRKGRSWIVLLGGGGSIGADLLRHYGVPADAVPTLLSGR